MFRLFIVCWAIVWTAFVPTYADAAIYGEQRIAEWWDGFKEDVTETWDHPQNYDLYLPFLTWHNRFTYDKEKTDRYNERPWGGGFGVSRYNADGNWSSLYAMAFKDSHDNWEPMIGYGWEKGWYLDQRRDFRLGLGLTAAVTARQDFANYVPLPVVLPLLSASYKQASVQFTYIPGTYNNGNVLFAWFRYGF